MHARFGKEKSLIFKGRSWPGGHVVGHWSCAWTYGLCDKRFYILLLLIAVDT